MNDFAVAYVAEGKLYLHAQEAKLIESPFVDGLLERASRERDRNDWKTESMGWNSRSFAPMLGRPPRAELRRIQFTGVAGGAGRSEMFYAIDTDYVGALFQYDHEGYERRIFHRNQFRARDLSRHPESGRLAFSTPEPDGTCHLAMMEGDGKRFKGITEGDCRDESPSWVPGEADTLVFQSAGLARNPQGFYLGLGPYGLYKLNFESGEMTTLIEDDHFDLLLPRMGSDGTLYFLRRPFEGRRKVSPWQVALDLLLFPVRLVRAIAHFLNFFSLMFTRKPLMTSGGPPEAQPDSRSMMLWGKIIDGEKLLRQQANNPDRGLVPKSWQLVKRSKDGTDSTLAEGVVSYDLRDGTIIYTDGTGVYALSEQGDRQKLTQGKLVERVAIVPK
jgi:hypothetical protein